MMMMILVLGIILLFMMIGREEMHSSLIGLLKRCKYLSSAIANSYHSAIISESSLFQLPLFGLERDQYRPHRCLRGTQTRPLRERDLNMLYLLL